jgi:hypothetical protein
MADRRVEIQRAMGLMPMQEYRDRDDRRMGQSERDQQMGPPRQIKDTGRDHRQILFTANPSYASFAWLALAQS